MRTVEINCSGCSAGLLDILIHRNEPGETKIKATCPFCKDSSFVVSVPAPLKGFFLQGVGRIKEDEDTADIPSTAFDGMHEEDGVWHVTVIKAKKDAKPIRR